MSTVSSFLKSSFLLTLGNVASRAISALSVPFIARSLGPEAFGVFSAISTLIQSSFTLASFGAEVEVQRVGAKLDQVGPAVVGRTFGVGIFLMLLGSTLCGIALLLMRERVAIQWFNAPAMLPWVTAVALLIALQPLSTLPLTMMAGLGDFKGFTVRTSVGAAISGLIGVLGAWFFGLTGAIYGMILAMLAQAFLGIKILRPLLQQRGVLLSLGEFFGTLKAIFKSNGVLYLTNVLAVVFNVWCAGVVSHQSGVSEIGTIRIAQIFASLVGILPGAAAPVVISFMAAGTTASARLKSIHLRSLIIIMALPAGVCTLILPVLLKLLFGAQYMGAEVPTWIYVWTAVLISVNNTFNQYLIAFGKTYISALACIASLALVLVGVKLFSAQHDATLVLFGFQALACAMTGLICYRPALADISSDDRQNFPALLLITLVYFFIVSAVYFSGASIWLKALASMILPLSYTALAVRFGFEWQERAKIRTQIQRAITRLRASVGGGAR
jgi:O-antigen/teichoic acid export membrane protein